MLWALYKLSEDLHSQAQQLLPFYLTNENLIFILIARIMNSDQLEQIANNEEEKQEATSTTILLSKKSMSLPKIKPLSKVYGLTQNQIYSNRKMVSIASSSQSPNKQKKPLYQYHRINWSVAPKCLVKGHEGNPVIYVCTNPDCQNITRLMCESCFYKEHKIHNKQCLAIDEIRNAEITEIRYWPFDKKFKTIYEFIKKHETYIENMIHDIRASFENLSNSVTKALKQAQNNYISRITNFYSKQSVKNIFIDKLIKQMNECFQMKQIHNYVKQIFTKQIRHDVFTEKLNKAFKSPVILEQRAKLMEYFTSPNTVRGTDIDFDKVYFIKKQKIIIDNIQNIEKALNEEQVVIDRASIGLQQIITQAITYLNQNSKSLLSSGSFISYEKKKFDDGTIYQGFLHSGKRVLLGMRDYRNGFIYFGEWKNNSRSGWGVYESKQISYRYAGYWKEDKKNGFGKQTTASHSYEGNFVDDKKDGFGTIIEGKVRYDITWKDDKKNGKGKKITEAGQKQVYFLNGFESALKGSGGANDGSYKDVNYLANMFANRGK